MSEAKKILIVEDNDLNLKLFQDLLAIQGYQILVSRDGIGVVDIVKNQQPDLILMDVHLPEQSGIDITASLKADQETAHVPVVAITAFAMKGDKEKIMQSGCQDYISKPVTSIPDFIDTIKRNIRG